MPLYAIGLLPLMSTIIRDMAGEKIQNPKQTAFADDLTGAGTLLALREWWDDIVDKGPYIGYFAKPSKSWLIVKEEFEEFAKDIFNDGGIKITSRGKRHLGAVIGCSEFKREYVEEKVDEWCLEIEKFAEIALIEPHAAYSAYIHGFQHRFTFIMRTIPYISLIFKRLDDVLTRSFIKNLFNRECSESERKLFSLPVRLGGLGIRVPSEMCAIQHENSLAVTESLVKHVINQQELLDIDELKIRKLKNKIKSEKVDRDIRKLEEVKCHLNVDKLKIL